MPQTLKKPPDLDDDFQPLNTSVKSQKPPDIDDEPTIDDLLNNAKLSLKEDGTTAPKPVEAKRKGFIESFSDSMSPLTEPLTDFFSRQANVSADIIDSPRLNRTPFEAQLEGFKAGATQGLGQIVDSMTSPINLAMEVATLGKGAATKYGLGKLAQGLSYGVKGLGAAMTGAGVKHTIEGETIPDKLFGVAETAGGLASMKTPGAKAKVPEALPIKPPYESPIVKRPIDPAQLADPNYNAGIGDPELAGSVPYQRAAEKPPDIEAPAPTQAFDPTSLKGLEPAVKPELEFLDPKTGETRPASQAQPGDIPLLPEAQPNVAPEIPARRAGGRMGTLDLGPTPEALAQPPDIPAVADSPLTAEFAYEWPGFNEDGSGQKMYRVKGGKFGDEGGSDVTAETLAELGLEIPPDTPPMAKPLTLEERSSTRATEPVPPEGLTRDYMERVQMNAISKVAKERGLPDPVLRPNPNLNELVDKAKNVTPKKQLVGDVAPSAAESPATFESWLDRLKSDRGALNAKEVADVLAGREPTAVAPDEAPIPRMPTPDSLNPEFDARRQAIIDDTARMERERLNAPRNIEREIFSENWNRSQHNTALREGRNINDARTPLTPEQQRISDSYKRIQAEKDKFSEWFSEQENQLPEGEFFKPPPEIEAAYKAKIDKMDDAHDVLVKKLSGGLEKAPPPVIDVAPNRGIRRLLTDETGSANVKDPLDALKELFEKSKKGALTPEEMAQAKKLAKEQSVSPKTEASPKEYLEGKSQVDTGPIIPENAGVKSGADVVTESLSKRLKKAVDEAGQPNAAAPEEISKLIDEGTKVLNNMPDGPEKPGVIRQILGANKALLTSWDVSAPGRQGKSLILNKAWWSSLDDMVKAWKSPVAAKLINDSITEHPSGYFKKPVSKDGTVGKSFAEKAGLELASTEEMFNAKLGVVFEKYSGIGKSSRAHTAFLNKLRSDQFVSMIEASKRAGRDPEHHFHLAEKYATFINDATGRGSVNIGSWKLERNLGALNDVFFAPKNMAGQIRTWNTVLNPYKYATADPVMRKQALRSLFAVAGLGMGVGQMAKLAGAQVSNDPTNSDFQKIRLGDSRIDLFGGYQQFPVAAMRFSLGQSTSSISGETTDLTEGKFGRQTRATLAERFFTNRLSPVGSFIWAWMSTREFDGKPFEVKKALYERIFPIAAKDIVELAQEDPFLAGVLTPTTLMGLTGTQHYSGR